MESVAGNPRERENKMSRIRHSIAILFISGNALRGPPWDEEPDNDDGDQEEELPRHEVMLPPNPNGEGPRDECTYFALLANNGPKKRPPPLTAAEAYELALEREEHFKVN